MRLRNNIFAAAFDELRRHHGIKTQKELALRMGVSEDTITRILKDYTEVTEDIITKLQTASGCIFNLQWLRGEDPEHMLAIDCVPQRQVPDNGENSSLFNAMLAAKDEVIAAKDEVIATMKNHIVSLQNELTAKDELFGRLKTEIEYGEVRRRRGGIAGGAQSTELADAL